MPTTASPRQGRAMRSHRMAIPIADGANPVFASTSSDWRPGSPPSVKENLGLRRCPSSESKGRAGLFGVGQKAKDSMDWDLVARDTSTPINLDQHLYQTSRLVLESRRPRGGSVSDGSGSDCGMREGKIRSRNQNRQLRDFMTSRDSRDFMTSRDSRGSLSDLQFAMDRRSIDFGSEQRSLPGLCRHT
ncbi:hypothetical protein M885DRAFT_527176 [Pelagophyceae sp. CCMP2097]|nr:hypothetical protein M885DRAFT_527176 [Pelagophyceae sp. CCMP2097]